MKKAIALAGIAAITLASVGNTFAATNIGTASVTGDASFDANIVWDDALPGTATGTVSGIKVTATVAPTLNMVISDKEIALGTLTAGTEASGSLGFEIGTNAANGVNITARSTNGGLVNQSNNSIIINDDAAGATTTDGVAESYKFSSAANATVDSTVSGFDNTAGNLAALEVHDNTTEHTIYTSNKPEQDDGTNADVDFTVAATSNAQTAAGDYEDTITFTVTGNF